jgi:uncharacterized protein DUF4403
MTTEILIHGKFALDKLSELLNKNVTGQSILENVKLESIVMKGDVEWLYAVMLVSGRYNGTVEAKFKLGISDSSPDLIIEKLKISLDGGHVLTKVANCVIKTFFEEKIGSKVQTILNKSFTDAIDDTTSRYGEVQFDGFSLKSDVSEYNFKEICWNTTQVTCVFHMSGVLRVEL